MKFEPENKEWIYEQLTVANKNVQSYFMKGEQSFFVPEEHKYPLYASEYDPVQILVDQDSVYFEGECINSSIFKNSRFNLENYKNSRSLCFDNLYKILHEKTKNLQHKTDELFIQLIFSDFMQRSDIIAVIDILLNQLRFKGIMILPLSLSISFALCTSHCAFVYENGFSFIDDFMLEDSFVCNSSMQNYLSVEDDDYAEEFSRLKSLDDNQKYSCRQCTYKEDTEAKISAHIEKEHKVGTFFYYENSGDFEQSFKNRLNYLFPSEKAEKVSQTIYAVDCEYEGAIKLNNYVELSFTGAAYFRELDSGKEIWMTDKEWQSARLRILKEKVLFFI